MLNAGSGPWLSGDITEQLGNSMSVLCEAAKHDEELLKQHHENICFDKGMDPEQVFKQSQYPDPTVSKVSTMAVLRWLGSLSLFGCQARQTIQH